jgi:hypothetical protein
MIQTPEQPIDITLSENSVKMLIAQPFLEFQPPIQEPFALLPGCAARMLAGIDRVFLVAGTFRPHFIVFPEFSLPGVVGVKSVAAYLSSINLPTIVIAGVSGLLRDEYAELCALPGMTPPEAANAVEAVADTQWINTFVTFVRDSSGATSMWVQPKLSPAWPEANSRHQTMFQGSVVRVFRAQFANGVPCRFLSVLCFDWVGRQNGTVVLDALLANLNTSYRAGGSQQALQWVFVLQHNEQPNHYTFLNSTTTFLTQAAVSPFVLRQDSAVVMVCTASSKAPSRAGAYGFSSVIFSPRAPFDTNICPPTYAAQAARLRAATTLGTCKDAVFREMGECIHAAEVRVPNFVQPDPTDRTPALLHAEAHPFSQPTIDPRVPGCGVPAVVKWANDELDDVPKLGQTNFSGTPIEAPLLSSQLKVIDGYRNLRSQDLAIRIDGASAIRAEKSLQNKGPAPDPAADIDTGWGNDERTALRHVVQTLTLI